MTEAFMDQWESGYSAGWAEGREDLRDEIIVEFATADTPNDFIETIKKMLYIA